MRMSSRATSFSPRVQGLGQEEAAQSEDPRSRCSRCPMATTMDVHPLAYPWTFTYFKKVANKSYEENTFTLGTTETVEDFWRLYVHLRRPVDERPTVCDYHVFREGIRPMWEDDANRDGGKWIVRLKKGLVARFWEDIVRSSLHTRRATTTNASRKRRSPRPTCGLVRSYWPSSAVSSAWATRSAAACSRFATKRTSSPCGTNPPTRAAFACKSATRCAPSCPCPRARPWSVSSGALKRAPPRARCTLSLGPSTHAHASITLEPTLSLLRRQKAHRLDARQQLLPQHERQLLSRTRAFLSIEPRVRACSSSSVAREQQAPRRPDLRRLLPSPRRRAPVASWGVKDLAPVRT